MRANGDGNERGLGILRQFMGAQGPQRFAPSQTAQIMLQRGQGRVPSAMAYSGQARQREPGGSGISIEPPILAGNRPDARVKWASGLGQFMEDTGLDNRAGNWLWNMMGGPLGNVNPWGGTGPLNPGWSSGPLPNLWSPFGSNQPIGPDTNLLGGSRHMGQRRNQ